MQNLRSVPVTPTYPALFHFQGPVAQVEERTPDKGEVRGSSPRRPTNQGENERI